MVLLATDKEREKEMDNITKLTSDAYKAVANARRARWELGRALLAEFYTNQGTDKNPDWVTNRSLDSEAETTSDRAKQVAKQLGKRHDAVKVFFSEAVKFAKAHKTADDAAKETIKAKKETKQKRFSKVKVAESMIDRLGEDKAVAVAKEILARAGK